MRSFLIDLNRYYQNHKAIILFFIVVAIMAMLVFKQVDKIMKKSGNSSNITTVSSASTNSNVTSTNQIINEIIESDEDKTEKVIADNNKKIQKSISSSEECIQAFVYLCNNRQFDYAYNLLSDDCKELLYPTKEDFINKYYNVIFKTHKVVSIMSFKNNTYKVDYSNTDIVNGKKDSTVTTDYITVRDGKLNLSSLIDKTNIANKISNQYLNIEVTSRIVYLNYELYTINIKNLTKADIFINDTQHTNLFLRDSYGNNFEVANEEYLENDYRIPSESSKSIQLKFMRSYNTSEDITSMIFKSIKIQNRLYYDNTSVDTANITGNVVFDQKMTNYPNKIELTVAF